MSIIYLVAIISHVTVVFLAYSYRAWNNINRQNLTQHNKWLCWSKVLTTVIVERSFRNITSENAKNIYNINLVYFLST